MTNARCVFRIAALISAAMHSLAYAQTSPQAASRTFAQNYKDMVLATCVATAYKNDKDAPVDAGSSMSALRDWTGDSERTLSA